MVSLFGEIKSVDRKSALIFLAGFVWMSVGSILLAFAFTWLYKAPHEHIYIFLDVGMLLALLVHHFALKLIVQKNVTRICSSGDSASLLSFMSRKSYLVIPVMIIMGVILRHSALPKQYLAVLYIAMGMALIFSSVRYGIIFIKRQN